MNDSIDDANDGLPTYAQASAEDGPSAARWNRWRGWIEKRAAERYADDPKAKISTGWGDSFNEDDDCGPAVSSDLPPPPPPPQRKPTSLTVSPDQSTPPPITSAGERLEPSNLTLHLFGSRFLPHSPDPINCVLPLPLLKIILIGTKAGLSVLDVHPTLQFQQPMPPSSLAHTLADAVSIPVWSGEAVHQLDLLEDSPDEQGNPCGVVLALVGRSDDESKDRSVRLYNLSSLANLAKWYTTRKDHAPLDLAGVTLARSMAKSRLKKAGKPPGLNKGLRSLVVDELSVSAVAPRTPTDSIKSPLDSPISPYKLPENPPYLASPAPSAASLLPTTPPPASTLTSPSMASLRSSSWDIVEDLPMRWATDFVLLYNANSKPHASATSYELWRPTDGKGSMKLVVATRSNILLFETPLNERAFKFVKEFYTPVPAKSMSFVMQADNNAGTNRGSSKPTSSVHVQEVRRHSSSPSRSHSRSAAYGTQLCLFIAFDKKAGLIRLGDAAVTEFEPFPDLGTMVSQGSTRSVKDDSGKRTFLRRSLVTSMDGHNFWKGHPSWLPVVELRIPALLASFLDPSTPLLKRKIHDSICFITRGRTTQVFPLPLRTSFSETHTAPAPLKAFTWQCQPTAIRARLHYLNSEPETIGPVTPILQLVGFGDHGLEIQETSFDFLKPQVATDDKGKGRASIDVGGDVSTVRAFADVGGSAGFLCVGGQWNTAAVASGMGIPNRAVDISRIGSTSTSLTSSDSFASTVTANSTGTLMPSIGGDTAGGTEGMFGWAQKGQEDYRVYYLGE
ncbi:hypothetical protein FRB94_007019 [Tulasnella sp. JGI-2019a]|nr:hypothetical protein FRB94_007019 [Tulasnella sp. JGI-2019a]KAG9016932.1 hypothetical protein FRB93_009462 [Tulasnella sp. JGI-2019a]KAG9040173.1 hypothetical protein FRB95_000102 [Tulasnella sp. JGI-2019a]